MSNLSFQQKKEVERLAQNTPNLKKYQPFEALTPKGNIKDGFLQLRNGLYIKKEDIYASQLKDYGTLAENVDTSSLKDLKGLGYDKNGNLKKGFAILKSGKVVSIKQLNVLFEEVKA